MVSSRRTDCAHGIRFDDRHDRSEKRSPDGVSGSIGPRCWPASPPRSSPGGSASMASRSICRTAAAHGWSPRASRAASTLSTSLAPWRWSAVHAVLDRSGRALCWPAGWSCWASVPLPSPPAAPLAALCRRATHGAGLGRQLDRGDSGRPGDLVRPATRAGDQPGAERRQRRGLHRRAGAGLPSSCFGLAGRSRGGAAGLAC